jgi:hypothetical protein
MNAWRMVVVSTALVSVFAIGECQQQPQQPEQGMCFQGIHCSGSALRLLPTWTATYPIVAPAYAKTRSAMAKRIGLGRKGRAGRKATGRRA